MTGVRPLPKADPDSEPFWAACREGRLAAQRCPACGRFRWPPMEFCPWCHHHGGEWTTLPGTGAVRSFVVAHRAFDPAFEDQVPYVIAHIVLDGTGGDVVLISNVVGAPAEDVAVGLRVGVEFLTIDGVALPQFRVVDSGLQEETSSP